jgi:hypothetical protein
MTVVAVVHVLQRWGGDAGRAYESMRCALTALESCATMNVWEWR